MSLQVKHLSHIDLSYYILEKMSFPNQGWSQQQRPQQQGRYVPMNPMNRPPSRPVGVGETTLDPKTWEMNTGLIWLIGCCVILFLLAGGAGLVLGALAFAGEGEHPNICHSNCLEERGTSDLLVEAASNLCVGNCTTCAQDPASGTDTGAETNECIKRCNCCAAQQRCVDAAERAGENPNCGANAVGAPHCVFDTVAGIVCAFPPTIENCRAVGFDL